MIKVLISDDHAIVRYGIAKLLKENLCDVETEEAGDGKEALEKARAEKFDLVILDIGMPKINGFEVLKLLKAEIPHLPVMTLSVHLEEEYAMRILRSGGSAYLNKNAINEELIMAVRKVLQGGKYVSAGLAEKLTQQKEAGIHETLSDREFQVLYLISCGKTISDIANELSLSVKTVSTYRERILQKTGMKNNAELMRYAMEHKLTP